MLALGIAPTAHLRVNVAANFLAPMLLTVLHSVANPLTLESFNLCQLLFTHHLLPLLVWVADLIAGQYFIFFSALAFLDCFLIASHTIAIVALLGALVLPTRHELFTKCVASRNLLSAVLPIAAK